MITSAQTTLLDREHAIRRIDALIAEARAREQPAVVRVVGPAGIGKSALLRHLAAREAARDGHPLFAAATPDEELEPAALVRRIAPAASARTNAQLASAMERVLSAVTLLCIDDLQWADELSTRVLRRAVRRAAPLTVILLGDRRTELTGDWDPAVVHLQPLRRTAAAALIRHVYSHASDDIVAEITDSAAGNPFTIEALAWAAAAARARAPGDVETTLEAAVGSRLRRSSSVARTILRYAAIAYAPTLPLVARATETSTEAAGRELNQSRDLVTLDGDRIVFRHGLLAEAIARSTDDVATYHRGLLCAHDLQDERASSLAAALHAALGCADRVAASGLALRLARTLAAQGALGSAASHANLALDLAPDPPPPQYAVEYAWIAQAQARDDEAASFLSRQLGVAIDRGDAAGASALIGSFAASAIALERPHEIDVYAERIAAIPGIEKTDIAKIRSARYNAAAFSGPPDAVLALSPETASWPDHRPLAFAAALLGDAARSDVALQRYRAGLAPRHARVTGADRALEAAIGLFTRGVGALVESDANFTRSEELREGYPTAAALRLVRYAASGLWDDADRVVAATADDDVEEPYPLLDARLMYHAIARRPLAAPARTLRTIQRLIAHGRRRHAIAAATWLWLVMARTREPVPADLRHFVGAELHATPMPYLFGGLPLAVAWLAPYVGVDASLTAIRSWSPHQSAWHRAHQALATGMVTGNHAELRAARDAFDALDAPVFAAIAGTLLPIPRAADTALSERLGLEDADTEPREALSQREADVAELAAQGRSNRDIAAELRISERTVEVHITNILRKLRLRSRAGIASRISGGVGAGEIRRSKRVVTAVIRSEME